MHAMPRCRQRPWLAGWLRPQQALVDVCAFLESVTLARPSWEDNYLWRYVRWFMQNHPVWSMIKNVIVSSSFPIALLVASCFTPLPSASHSLSRCQVLCLCPGSGSSFTASQVLETSVFHRHFGSLANLGVASVHKVHLGEVVVAGILIILSEIWKQNSAFHNVSCVDVARCGPSESLSRLCGTNLHWNLSSNGDEQHGSTWQHGVCPVLLMHLDDEQAMWSAAGSIHLCRCCGPVLEACQKNKG